MFTFLLVILLPFPAKQVLSPVTIAIGIETIIISTLIFVKRKNLKDLMFLLAVVSFMTAGMSTAHGLEQYFQIFSFFIAYIFLVMIFAFPESNIRRENEGMGDFFALQKRLTDTTKRLQMTEERYHDLFEHINSGVAVYEPVDKGRDFVLIDFNSSAERIERISREDVIGKRVTEVFPGVKKFGLLDVFKAVWDTGIPKQQPISLYKNENVNSWRKNTVYKLSTGEVVAVYDDVTQQKRDEIALKQAHYHLKKLNEKLDKKVENRTAEIQKLLKQKDEFINQLGHDLKNPLNPLINLLPILEKEVENPNHREILRVVNRNVGYMKNLVKKTLELAQLNSPDTEFIMEEIDLLAEINKMVETNRLLFEQNQIKFVNKISREVLVFADRVWLEELLNNLISNSIKYSRSGGTITIDVSHMEQFVTVSLTDAGIGMTEEQLNHIFDEFYKADGSRHDFDSSGLGMSICKRIIEKHGGRIWVESEGPDVGSTFYFTLPKKPTEKKKQSEIHLYEDVSHEIDLVLKTKN